MDLAKIRQKARKDQSVPPPAIPPRVPVETAAKTVPAELPIPQRPTPVDEASDIYPAMVVEQPLESFPPQRRGVPTDPIEAILAGRAAAGCGDEPDEPAPEHSAAEVADFEEFLCFRVSDEIYGINIMRIKEIIKPREVTEVPRAPSFVTGVISLRGVIIPILDMPDRLRLGRSAATGRERVVVVKHGEAFTGLLVDEVIQVVRIAKNGIEPAPAVLEEINREFVAGIGRSEERMIILLNLDTIADIDLF